MEIRSFTITFDSLRRKQKNAETKKNSSLKKLKDCKIWWTVNQHLSTSMNIIMTVKSKLEKISFDRPEAHAFAPRQDGTNLENEAPNTFAILKKGITSINVLPA